jgi:hypothetical protein
MFMKYFEHLIIVILIISFSSCSSNVLKNTSNSNDSSNSSQSKIPPHIAENQSTVTAIVEQLNVINKKEYTIKAKILKVEENPAYLNMASIGAVYELAPNYKVDEKGNIIQNETNTQLFDLSRLNIGDTFEAIIFYVQNKGWLIEKVL